MLIALDIDGVLYPWHEVARDWLIENGYIEKETSVENAFKFLKKQNRLFIENVVAIPILYERRVPNKDIIDIVWRIHAEGNEILYLTSRDEKLLGVTYRFLKDFPAPSSLFISENKQRFCLENGVDVLMDDRVGNLINHRNTLALCVQSFEHPKIINPRFKSIWKAYLFAKCSLNGECIENFDYYK